MATRISHKYQVLLDDGNRIIIPQDILKLNVFASFQRIAPKDKVQQAPDWMNLKEGEVFVDKEGNLFVANLKEFQTAQGIIPPEAYDKVQENMHTMIFGDTIHSHPNSPGKIDPNSPAKIDSTNQGANLVMSPTNPPGSETSINPVDTLLESSQNTEDNPNPDNTADQSSANTDLNSDSFIRTQPPSGDHETPGGDHIVTATPCKDEGVAQQGNTQGSNSGGGEDCVGQPETPDVSSPVYAEDLESPIEVRGGDGSQDPEGGDASQDPEPGYEIEEEEDGSVIINTKPKDGAAQVKMPEIVPESEPLPEVDSGCESGYDPNEGEDVELLYDEGDEQEVEFFNMEDAEEDEEMEFSIEEEEIDNYVKDKMASSQAEQDEAGESTEVKEEL